MLRRIKCSVCGDTKRITGYWIEVRRAEKEFWRVHKHNRVSLFYKVRRWLFK